MKHNYVHNIYDFVCMQSKESDNHCNINSSVYTAHCYDHDLKSSLRLTDRTYKKYTRSPIFQGCKPLHAELLGDENSSSFVKFDMSSYILLHMFKEVYY